MDRHVTACKTSSCQSAQEQHKCALASTDLCLRLQAFPEGIPGGFYNGVRPSTGCCDLEEVVVTAGGHILAIATDGTIKLVEDAVILVQVTQLQHTSSSHHTSVQGSTKRQTNSGDGCLT